MLTQRWDTQSSTTHGIGQERKNELKRSGNTSQYRSALGYAYGMSGDRAHARQILDELKSLSGRQYVPAYDLAIVYVGLGDKEQAYQWLEKAFAERSARMVYLNMDPRLDNLRSEARFKALGAERRAAGQVPLTSAAQSARCYYFGIRSCCSHGTGNAPASRARS